MTELIEKEPLSRSKRSKAAQVILITGGTSGIGHSLAEAFLAQGALVAICGRSETALEQFRKDHPEGLAIRADVTIAADRAAMLDAVVERFGKLDVLVNNAGTFVDRDFTSGKDATEDLEPEIALNLTAPIQLTSEVLVRWPTISSLVFVTSGLALAPPTRAPTYGAVKAGLHAFAEALRRQLAPRDVHVLELLPGLTDTPMNASHPAKHKMSPEAVADVTLKALAGSKPMALPGIVKALPMLLRLAPRTTKRLVAES
ncbi:SDR family NAD(P)-dependent oxidoreductase [Aurantiacibacter flavus]|uniref:SDR family NAD(P)-dependent oxidoreductase n=1 Tax=Aurantiacibacter flavus TaxID=3145232 RepID=A0ABV0CZA3_9SPHN